MIRNFRISALVLKPSATTTASVVSFVAVFRTGSRFAFNFGEVMGMAGFIRCQYCKPCAGCAITGYDDQLVLTD